MEINTLRGQLLENGLYMPLVYCFSIFILLASLLLSCTVISYVRNSLFQLCFFKFCIGLKSIIHFPYPTLCPKGSIMICWCGSLLLLQQKAPTTAASTTTSSSCASRPLDLVSLTVLMEKLQHRVDLLDIITTSLPKHSPSLPQTLIQKRTSLTSTWPVNQMEGLKSQLPGPTTTSASCPSLWSSAKVASRPEQTGRWAMWLLNILLEDQEFNEIKTVHLHL